MDDFHSMNSAGGERLILGRMQRVFDKVDHILSTSSNLRRAVIAACFTKTISGPSESIINPIWDPKLYSLYCGKGINYITPEAALFITHRSIVNLEAGYSPKPYDPREALLELKQLRAFFDVAPYAMLYVTDMALLRQIRKGIVWETVTGKKVVNFKTNYRENANFYESHISIPYELESSIELYEKRKVRNNLPVYWSSDISSSSLNNIIGLFLSHREHIEEYYGCPMIALLAFFCALRDFCQYLNNGEITKNLIGLQFTKKALIDRLAVLKISGNTGFERGLYECEHVLGRIDRQVRKKIMEEQEMICNDILVKYSRTFRELPGLHEFIGTPNLLIETQPNLYLLIYYFFNQIGGTFFEKPLTVSGGWQRFRGKAFEDFCHEIIRQGHGLKTFRRKIRDDFGRDIGDIDLGILKPPYIFICNCKDYRINVKFVMGEVDAVLQRIEDNEHGYLSWLSKLDELCRWFSKEFVSDMISQEGFNPELFRYLVPIIVTWRPEFILDISSDLLDKETPRLCTILELSEVIKNISANLHEKEFVIHFDELSHREIENKPN